MDMPYNLIIFLKKSAKQKAYIFSSDFFMSAFLASHNFGKHPIMTEVRNKRKLFPLFPDNTFEMEGGGRWEQYVNCGKTSLVC